MRLEVRDGATEGQRGVQAGSGASTARQGIAQLRPERGITVRGASAARAARDLDVHATGLRRGVHAAGSKGMQAFRGH